MHVRDCMTLLYVSLANNVIGQEIFQKNWNVPQQTASKEAEK